MNKKDLLGKPGSPLTANQEGSIVQTRVANSDNSGTSLVDQRPGLTDAPLGTRNSSISQNPKMSMFAYLIIR